MEEAIFEEISYFNERVWTAVPMSEALKVPNAKVIGARFVVCNKNDSLNPDVRARFVAQEVSHSNGISFLCGNAATGEQANAL